MSLLDGTGILQKINVSKEIYESFNNFELIDKSQMTKTEKYIASYDLSDEYINKHRIDESISIDDEIIMKATFQELRDAIEQLPEIQKRRIKMYYFENKNTYQIAILENCSNKRISNSIKNAINNLQIILRK